MKMKRMMAIAVLLMSSAAWGVKTPGLGPDDNGPLKVAQDIQSLRAIQQVKPVYPELARISHTEGSVTLQVSITKEGTVAKVEVVSGPALLTRAAQDAVKQWKYKPTIVNGQTMEVITQVRVNFTLGTK
jgi:protein TonB